MLYPEDFTADDIMEFEYEYNRYLDLQEPGSIEAVNVECRIVAEKQQEKAVDEQYEELFYDELERDWDEPYEPDTNDDWYDEQYEVDYSDF